MSEHPLRTRGVRGFPVAKRSRPSMSEAVAGRGLIWRRSFGGAALDLFGQKGSVQLDDTRVVKR
jgi:hypothetical protein